EVALAFSALVEENEALVHELDRVALLVGRDGQIRERASLGPVGGSWAIAIDSVNSLIENVAVPTLETTRVLGAVAAGDLSQTMSVHLDGHQFKGGFAELGSTVNSVVSPLRAVSSRVARVGPEVGGDGKAGTPARA